MVKELEKDSLLLELEKYKIKKMDDVSGGTSFLPTTFNLTAKNWNPIGGGYTYDTRTDGWIGNITNNPNFSPNMPNLDFSQIFSPTGQGNQVINNVDGGSNIIAFGDEGAFVD